MKLSIIREAAHQRKTVIFDYNKKTDESFESHVEIEPYSLRQGKDGDRLFGWEISKNGIRNFILNRMYNVRIGDKSFAPRFPVEI